MDLIRWFETPIDTSISARVDAYDHYRIMIGEESAVLITFLGDSQRQQRLLAVTHPAARLHPDPPDWVIELIADLPWSPCAGPPALTLYEERVEGGQEL